MTADALFDHALVPWHHTDASESREAAAAVNGQHQLVLVLTALRDAQTALTDDDLAQRCGLLRTSAGTRRGVAVRLGFVVRAGRGLSALGNPASTWRITDRGVEYLAETEGKAA